MRFIENFFDLQNAITFKLTNFACESYNKTWYVVHNCRLKMIKRNIVGAYFNGTVMYPVNDMTVYYQFFKRANGYKPWLMKGWVDFCRYMRRPYNPVAQMIFSFFLDFTNLNHTCPIVVSSQSD